MRLFVSGCLGFIEPHRGILLFEFLNPPRQFVIPFCEFNISLLKIHHLKLLLQVQNHPNQVVPRSVM